MKGEHTRGMSHSKKIFQDSLGADMLASHSLCTKKGKVYTHWSPNPWYSMQQRREEKNYKCSCKLNTKINLTTYSSFPSTSESQNICQPTEIHDDEETTWLKVALVHWVEDGLLLRQLRKHYVSTWLSPGMESNVSSRDSSKTDVSTTWPIKTSYLPFYSQTTIIKPFPDIRKADTLTDFQPRKSFLASKLTPTVAI